MQEIEKILFPTDYSYCAEHAFAHAVYLASEHNADLHVLHITERETSDDGVVLVEGLLQGAKGELGAVLQGFGTAGETGTSNQLYTVTLHGEDPAGDILAYAEKHGADVIVMGTHGRRGVRRFFTGSVTEKVVRHATCPVLTVGEQTRQKPGAEGQRLLVPVDFSESMGPLLAEAKQLALAYRAEVDLLHVVQESVYPIVYGIEPVVPLSEQVGKRAEEELHYAGAAAFGNEVVFRAEVLVGHPIRDIAAYAERGNHAMIVIATHGLTGLKHLLLGSVTEAVIRTAPCPVYTVRSSFTDAANSPATGELQENG